MAIWLALDFTGLVLGGMVQHASRDIWWGLALALGIFAVIDAYRHGRRRELAARAI